MEVEEGAAQPLVVQMVDQGGSVVPKQTCHHVFTRLNVIAEQLSQSMTRNCQECDDGRENWVCLSCNHTACSRYVNQHAEGHWEETLMMEEDMTQGGHCLALSLSDLSVWCYACQSYIKHDRLLPLLVRAESVKFNTEEKVQLLEGAHIGPPTTGVSFEDVVSPLHSKSSGLCFERPARIDSIMSRLLERHLLAKCRTIPPPPEGATESELRLVHTADYLSRLSSTTTSLDTRQEVSSQGDLFVNQHTYGAAKAACGSLLALTRAVARGEVDNGIAIIRPPGHHAGPQYCGGYCFVNNVAVAAQVARTQLGFQRVLILDWDIHHGNGIQDIFYNDPSVLYMSIHRHRFHHESSGETASFQEQGESHHIGEGPGQGYNINIALTHQGPVGDTEYLSIMERVVAPISREYNPDLVLVAAGFDAGVGDRHLSVGGFAVTPSCFAHLARRMMALAQGKVLLSLEGGYGLSGLADCVESCLRSLLGQPLPPLPLLEGQQVNAQTVTDIDTVIRHHQPFWACLRADHE